MADKPVVVITGSSGRIGVRLVERLGEKYQSVGLDFIAISPPTPSMEFVYVDLSSDASVEKAFQRIRYAYGNRIASIVHLAAFYSFEGTRLENYEKITVKGTERLLKAAQNFQVDQFLFTSTMLVHRPTSRGIIQNEDSPIEGKWHYPASKVRTEHLIQAKHGSIPYVILRIAGCYSDECDSIPLSQHMSRIYEKQLASTVFPGNVHHGVSYIHFDDLIDQIMLLIERRSSIPPELILLSTEEDSISYRDLQTEFGRLIHGNKNWPMVRVPKVIAKVGAWAQGLLPGPKPFIKPWMVDLADDNYEFSMEKSRKVLGWNPKRSLRATLAKMAASLKKDPVAFYKRHGIPLSNYVKKHAKRTRNHG